MPCFALIDCNNFYASCERVFNPKLIGKPVVVLSSNDGCVIARSNEAKTLGIKMAEPFFKISKLCQRHHVNVFSTNFALYGDMSKRVMHTLQNLCPDMEIYSIDEAFLRLDYLTDDPMQYAKTMRDTVFQHTGIPVSVGVAPTKTLSKVASCIAKKSTRGVYDLRDNAIRQAVLKTFPVEKIWGVGRSSAEKLHHLKIYTAAQLIQQPDSCLKKQFSIMMSRLTNELRGISCLSLEAMQTKQNMVCSRSFGKPITALSDLSEAISTFTAKICGKARLQKTKAQGVAVFIRTSKFDHAKPFYSAHESQMFVIPSNDTVLVLNAAIQLLKKNV